jgi:hypothetical protein
MPTTTLDAAVAARIGHTPSKTLGAASDMRSGIARELNGESRLKVSMGKKLIWGSLGDR